VSTRRLWSSAALVGAGILFVLAPHRAPARAGSERGLAQRLLGPIASLAASAQWVRVDLAFRAGRTELALARAEQALALDPRSPELWHDLAWEQAFSLASPEREPDPALRLAWLESGLATAAEGEARSRDPAELALLQGLILLKAALLDPDLPWPGGVRGMWGEAARHFERAEGLGHRAAAELRRAALNAAAGPRD
jgi:hypothetical protein